MHTHNGYMLLSLIKGYNGANTSVIFMIKYVLAEHCCVIHTQLYLLTTCLT